MTLVCPICREAAPAVTDRFCELCGARLQPPSADVADRVEVDLAGLAGISDRGHLHLRNEDAMALGRLPEDGPATTVAAVVCDGVSTVRRPSSPRTPQPPSHWTRCSQAVPTSRG